MASPHSWINEMPVLWGEDGMPVWIDSDAGTFVLCRVLCACWIGVRIGVDGSWIGGRKAIDCRPLGQSLKAAKCHKFTVTFITAGNRDYWGRGISRVLANKNLDPREVVVRKVESIKCSDFGISLIPIWSSHACILTLKKSLVLDVKKDLWERKGNRFISKHVLSNGFVWKH